MNRIGLGRVWMLGGVIAWLTSVAVSGCGPQARSGAREFAVTESHVVFLAGEVGLHSRCAGYDMARAPATFDAFEAEILAWIATCVTSRTDDAHREDALVRHNHSLAAVWRQVTPGQRVWIIPRYQWSESGQRVESIEFSLADRERVNSGQGGDTTTNPERAVAPSPDRRVVLPGPGRTGPGQTSKPRPRRQILPPTLRGIVDDARAVVRWLRDHGGLDDARKLAALIDKASPYATDVALLVGTYYFAVKFRAGKLLFVWGWNAAGPQFARAAARLERLLPGAERAIGQVVDQVGRISRGYPQLAGSNIEWKVLDQVIDPSIPAQLDDMACGPACAQLALRDRGIEMSQAELIRRARSAMPSEIRTKMVTPRTITRLLHKLDPQGGWTDDFEALLKRTRSARQIFDTLGQRGSWIAQVGSHFVYVDGLDSTGYVWVRDPWYEPGVKRGIRVGSRYRVSLQKFVQFWLGIAIYRQ